MVVEGCVKIHLFKQMNSYRERQAKLLLVHRSCGDRKGACCADLLGHLGVCLSPFGFVYSE